MKSFVLLYNFQKEFLYLSDAEIHNYTLRVIAVISNGSYEWNSTLTNEPRQDGRDIQWSFSGAFLYSLTVITTIGIGLISLFKNTFKQQYFIPTGYGNVAPRSPWGKMITIIYGIVGMPLFLLYLSNVGDILARGFKWTFARCCQCR